jgi:hypothetical protein
MGHPHPPNIQWRTRDYRPQGPIQSPPNQTIGEKAGPGKGAMERNSKAHGRLDPAAGTRKGPTNARHQLDLCCPKTKKTSLLILEKHRRHMVQHQSKLDQNRPDHPGRGAQAAHFWKPPHHQPGWQPTGGQQYP